MLSANDKLLVADALSGDIITRLSGHDDRVFAIAVASDGRWLASASGDQTIKVWEVSTGREVRTFRTSDEVRALALSWDLRVVSAGSDGSVWVWDVAGDERGHPLGGHGERIVDVILSPDGQFAAGASSRALVLWDLSTGREVRRYASADTGPAVVAFTPDGRSLVSGNWDGTLTVFEVSTGRPGRTITEGISRISAMAFSPTGARLVVGRDDGGLQLWRLADPRPAAMLRGHRERIVSVVFSPDGAWVVTGSHDGTVHLWDGSTGQEVRTFRAGAAVTATALTHDGRRVMAGSRHGAIRVWDRESGLEMQSLSAPQVDITGLAASADGQRLLSWAETGGIGTGRASMRDPR